MIKTNKIFLCVICIVALIVSVFNVSKQQVIAMEDLDSINAKSYIVMDSNGKVLYENNKDYKREVASICKLMTTLITLEEIDKGNIKLDDKFLVSEYAASAEGSQAFLDANNEYFVEDLLKSVIVASANDSAIVLAENIAGSEDNFVKLMNNKAKILGMHNTMYSNSTGLTNNETQFSTVYDTAILINEVSKYPIYRKDCAIWMDKLTHSSGRQTELVNTNRLIKYYPYCKTGKTGFTDEAGYCLSSTAEKDGFKLTCVVLGCDSSADRFTDSATLYNLAYSNYLSKQILTKGEIVDNNINVIASKNNFVKVEVFCDYSLTLLRSDENNYSIKYEFVENITAPKMQGEKVGSALVIVGGNIVDEIDIVLSENLEKQNYSDILNKIIDNFGLIK